MDGNEMLALEWMLRQRSGGVAPPLRERSVVVKFSSDYKEVIEFEVQKPKSVKSETYTKSELDTMHKEIAVYRMALRVRIAAARRQLDAFNGRLAIARAKHLRKSLDADDDVHLGFFGFGVLERTRPIEQVQLAADEKPKLAAAAAANQVRDAQGADNSESPNRSSTRSSMKARFGSFCRCIQSASTFGRVANGAESSRRSQSTGWLRADVRVNTRFLTLPRRNKSRVAPWFDSVAPHPDIASS
eukprot:TRINITY_DN4389_c1_g1_i1.p1 TRINITY_DN4389_c1_g1~~TRINITY_DN4389_c1_g1_i1.p1  ORF type:complete len:244 (+),score=44.26 TRINITY_DN4389_c1_g1_i1:89-820(+)